MFDFFSEEDFGFLGNCKKCGLGKKPIAGVYGDGAKGVLIVLPKPDEAQVTLNSFRTGKFDIVKKVVDKLGHTIDKDCWVTGIPLCPVTGSKSVSSYVDCCSSNIHNLIGWKKPKVILLFGIDAVRGVIPWEDPLGTIYRWRGRARLS